MLHIMSRLNFMADMAEATLYPQRLRPREHRFSLQKGLGDEAQTPSNTAS